MNQVVRWTFQGIFTDRRGIGTIDREGSHALLRTPIGATGREIAFIERI
jgi:hypothetical protein